MSQKFFGSLEQWERFGQVGRHSFLTDGSGMEHCSMPLPFMRLIISRAGPGIRSEQSADRADPKTSAPAMGLSDKLNMTNCHFLTGRPMAGRCASAVFLNDKDQSTGRFPRPRRIPPVKSILDAFQVYGRYAPIRSDSARQLAMLVRRIHCPAQ